MKISQNLLRIILLFFSKTSLFYPTGTVQRVVRELFTSVNGRLRGYCCIPVSAEWSHAPPCSPDSCPSDFFPFVGAYVLKRRPRTLEDF